MPKKQTTDVAPREQPITPGMLGADRVSPVAVYRGVVAKLSRRGPYSPDAVTFWGSPEDLRTAGVFEHTDVLPQPRGVRPIGRESRSRASGLLDGRLCVHLEQPDAAARDAAFRRFMSLAIEGVGDADA